MGQYRFFCLPYSQPRRTRLSRPSRGGVWLLPLLFPLHWPEAGLRGAEKYSKAIYSFSVWQDFT